MSTLDCPKLNPLECGGKRSATPLWICHRLLSPQVSKSLHCPTQPFGVRWQAQRDTALDLSQITVTANIEESSLSSSTLWSAVASAARHRFGAVTDCCRRKYRRVFIVQLNPLECGGKRSATPLWILQNFKHDIRTPRDARLLANRCCKC